MRSSPPITLILLRLLLLSCAPTLGQAHGRKAFKIPEPKTLLPLLPHSEQLPWASYLNTTPSPSSSSSFSASDVASILPRVSSNSGWEQGRRSESEVPDQSEAEKSVPRNDVQKRKMFSQREIAEWDIGERQVRALEWDLQITYEGKTFFDGWDFFTKDDPTHGLVNYIDGPSAFQRGNAFWSGDGKPGIQVDHWSHQPVGAKRDSVRITTKSLFSGGLIIADIALAPWGCGVWPAIWTLGYEGDWPTTGEMDILEGIQAMRQNYYTIHTLPGCEINQSPGMFRGTVGNTLCDSTKGGSGCTIVSPSYSSFGENLNLAGGGVFAMLWTGDGIRFWDWNRTLIPADITSGHPTPETWGLPAAAWDASTCDPAKYFQAQVLVVNIDLCGDWAGDLYSTFSYCPGTCAEYVAEPTNLNNTVMLLNSIKVYQQSGNAGTNQQAETNNNLTGAGGAVPLNESGASALGIPTSDPSGSSGSGSSSTMSISGSLSTTAGRGEETAGVGMPNAVNTNDAMRLMAGGILLVWFVGILAGFAGVVLAL